jgi:hypothetical protein
MVPGCHGLSNACAAEVGWDMMNRYKAHEIEDMRQRVSTGLMMAMAKAAPPARDYIGETCWKLHLGPFVFRL